MASIAEFLIYLAENPAELERFRAEPDSVIESWQGLVGHELTPEQISLLKSGELVDIRGSVEAEFNVPGEARPTKIVWGIVWGMSEPDQGGSS
jgi:hypothetical protein